MSAPNTRRTHQPASHPAASRPSARQLSYLRALADRAGQTFAYPRTTREASTEIRRLEAAAPSSRVECAIEPKQIADAIARGPEDSAAVSRREISGYLSNATWKERS